MWLAVIVVPMQVDKHRLSGLKRGRNRLRRASMHSRLAAQAQQHLPVGIDDLDILARVICLQIVKIELEVVSGHTGGRIHPRCQVLAQEGTAGEHVRVAKSLVPPFLDLVYFELGYSAKSVLSLQSHALGLGAIKPDASSQHDQ